MSFQPLKKGRWLEGGGEGISLNKGLIQYLSIFKARKYVLCKVSEFSTILIRVGPLSFSKKHKLKKREKKRQFPIKWLFQSTNTPPLMTN